jgi:WASH complex subunit strumpellin
MLYVLLYFAPELLHKKESTMREIADKFFADNWVVPFYMGFHVDLQDAWAPYKAAMAALNNIVSKNNVTEVVTKYVCSVRGGDCGGGGSCSLRYACLFLCSCPSSDKRQRWIL